MFNVDIVADSISPLGDRLTTFSLTYPRFIHAEFMTHRVFSRNASSSRAIPVQKIIQQVKENPAMPIHWGKNQRGMQAGEELDPATREQAQLCWTKARNEVLNYAHYLVRLGVHKQIVNRLLEPWHHIKVVCTATEWENFFALRCHPDAQPEMRKLAEMIRDAYYAATPVEKNYGKWHLPYVRTDEQLEINTAVKVSVARCARVSYMRHDGTPAPIEEDLALHDRLLESGHMSPFEHQAYPCNALFVGNFKGWRQYRKTIPNENRKYDYKVEGSWL